MQSALPKTDGSSERQGLRIPECLAGAVRAADSVQVCALRPPAVADSCPACAGQSCQRMGFPDVGGGETSSVAKANRKEFSQRSGERERHQELAPTAANSRNSLPALNAVAVVQVRQLVQSVLRKRAMALLMLPARCRQEPNRQA